MGFADIHMHTIFSYDGTAPVRSVLQQARKVGLDVVAITDHDEIGGAQLALDLAPEIGIDVIPGIEITTAEGDLLALFVQKAIAPGLSLIETLVKVGEQGGICVAPHPMAGGLGMKSLNGFSIIRALRHADASRVLVGIETYNATALDRESSRYGRILAERAELAQTGSSDAHVLPAIGLGRTEFPGKTAEDFAAALHNRTTIVHKGKVWNPAMILGSWATGYLSAVPIRMGMVVR
jgi:predicted metal-dependent phosphoesterase TrpH